MHAIQGLFFEKKHIVAEEDAGGQEKGLCLPTCPPGEIQVPCASGPRWTIFCRLADN